MRKLLLALCLTSLAPNTVWAQAAIFPPNEAGVTMGHWHLNSRDIEANKKILVAMGGTAIKSGNFEIVKFPGVAVYLNQVAAKPATGGTIGSVVNHVGLTVPNVHQAVAKWKAAGVKIDRPYTKNAQTGAALAFIYDPWGTYIELNERTTPL